MNGGARDWVVEVRDVLARLHDQDAKSMTEILSRGSEFDNNISRRVDGE